VIYAGQGVHYARAWRSLKELAELLEAPVTTSLEGKSAFDETHPLYLGSGGKATPKAVRQFLDDSDVLFGIGCSFATTNFGVKMPKVGPERTFVHATLDPADINKDIPCDYALIGDAQLVLDALLLDVKDRLKGQTRGRAAGIVSTI